MRARPILLSCLLLAACGVEAKPIPADPVTVTDGDTIKLASGERVRLSNIDAPELPPHSKCWAEAGLALQASREVERLLIRPGLAIHREGVDRYGRTLARVTVEGHDVGDMLVNLGLAARWTGRKWDWCAAPNYADADAPAMSSGPEGNGAYREWLASDAAARPVTDPWAVRATYPDPAPTPAH